MFRFVVLLSVAAVISGQSTPVNQCTFYNAPLPINTYIEGCDSLPCELPQLQDAVIHMTYKAPENISRMRTLATAFLPGLFPIQYPLLANGETCNFLTNTNCPVQKDEIIQYSLKMFIQPSFPVGIQTTLEFRIQDGERLSNVVCIQVPIRVVSPANKDGADDAASIDLA
ncbi:unnamed protein product [Chrysodeixis includens]|uniref:MD-2-related lipid-recognition domain-containing protein n=1 Tax=Chrysodeixis includens TaxID=689277 RepID=A0A9P0BUQ8_CHRIL|nr:unnamed protein product [Chrysodeixis includens]